MISDIEAEAMLWNHGEEIEALTDEVEALRALVRKVQGSPGWWAALSYVDGVRGSKSRWSEAEQELLRRAGL